MFRRACSLSLNLFFAVLLASAVSAQNLVANGSFESPNVGNGLNRYSSPGIPAGFSWTVGGSGVDLVGTIWAAQDGTQSIDLNQYIPGQVLTPPGSVSQIIVTTPGTTYLVDFYMAANPDHVSPPEEGPAVKTMDVSFGASTQSYSFNVTGHTLSNPGWIEQTFFSTATSANTMLSFVSTSNGYAGMTVDNVRVTAVPASVPEPGAPIAGFIGSIAGMCLLPRCRRKALSQA